MEKDPRWKQQNPVDQMTAILGSMEGDFSNWVDGIAGDAKYGRRVEDALGQLKRLQPFLRDPSLW